MRAKVSMKVARRLSSADRDTLLEPRDRWTASFTLFASPLTSCLAVKACSAGSSFASERS
jgi:hypothetical protein